MTISPAPRSAVAASRRRRELDHRGTELRRRAAPLLGTWPEDAGDRADELRSLIDAISDVLMTQTSDSTLTVTLSSLAADMQELALDLYRHDATARELRTSGFGQALRRLHDETSSTRVVDRACEEVRVACGLKRVLLSRVVDGSCQPWLANDEDREEPWFVNHVDGIIDLRALSLAHVVAERRADVIDTDRTSDHDMVRTSHSTSYVVAPVMPGGCVVGLFHADHGSDGRRCDDTDRNVLRAFAGAFGNVYERAFLLERLRQQQDRIRRTLMLVDGELREAIDLWSDPVAGARMLLDELTPRERDVLGLLARGLANHAIAERLDISHRTVKTHVGHILDKLGASNRSEVIGRLRGPR